ncbi:MAG: hypothetical protein IJU23_14330 [Proteobacteria bacterium]|nr:hypothetical protein [Pseudomonadota bacterium]
MFELFVMSLHEYWADSESNKVESSVSELMDVLSEHYGKEITWNEDELSEEQKNEEIAVDVIEDEHLTSLQAVAAKLELDGNLDGLELDPDDPWGCDVFARLEDKLEESDDGEIKTFKHLLNIGNGWECVIIPVDVDSVAEINVDPDDFEDEDYEDDDEEDGEDEEVDDSEEEDEECDCCECDDDDCCCDEDADNVIDIASAIGLQHELELIAKHLKLDLSIDIDSEEIHFDDDDNLQTAKLCCLIFYKKLKEALEANQPLILRLADGEEYDDDEEDDDTIED